MSISIPTHLIRQIPMAVARKYRVVPVREEEDRLVLVSDLHDPEAQGYLEVLFDKNILIEQEGTEKIDTYLNAYYLQRGERKRAEFNENSDDFIFKVIQEANDLNSSDIHIERYQDRCRIRMRMDGKLVERYELKKEKYNEYINKIKILSRLDIAEKRLPQDGRILIKEEGLQYDIRVSILPVMFGEKVVLRLLSNDADELSIEDLGLNSKQIGLFREAIAKPQGMILISGPTGSGKTTTLYATLKQLNKIDTNVLTIEDPIEYTLEGINQVQLNPGIGLDFARALRTFLRQDPDIIMVGEIRDLETANIAIRAAMTGHMVMSTLHTNSAYGIVTRLMEMGISDYLIADTLNLAVAQRLVRLLCEECKTTSDDLASLPQELRSALKQYYVPVGCPSCLNTGFKGRRAIYEILPMTDHLRATITDSEVIFDPSTHTTLKDGAIALFKEGRTSIEEIYSYLL